MKTLLTKNWEKNYNSVPIGCKTTLCGEAFTYELLTTEKCKGLVNVF